MTFQSCVAVICLIGINCFCGTSLAKSTENQITEKECVPPGKVLIPADESWTTNIELINSIPKNHVVLLGEHHDNIEHHRWQYQTISGLHALHKNIVLGFEMFPRQAQPILDRWVAGELTEEEFLEASRWDAFWSFDPSLYMPLFHYARMNNIPMYALNVDRALIREIGTKGWDNVAENKREGVSTPKQASEGYRELLANVFMSHEHQHGNGPSKEKMLEVMQQPGFARFVESQQTWDRAMAEVIAKGLNNHKGSVFVAVLGSGHMMYRFGVPEQLEDLGLKNISVLIPWDPEFECKYISQDFSDAVVGLKAIRYSEQQTNKPRLGVYLDSTGHEVVITKVLPDSLAAKNMLKNNDIILEVAGVKATTVKQVVDAVKLTQPGTWLPLKIKRSNKTMEITVKFPAATKSD